MSEGGESLVGADIYEISKGALPIELASRVAGDNFEDEFRGRVMGLLVRK